MKRYGRAKTCLLTIPLVLAAACGAWGGTLEPGLARTIAGAPADQEFAVIVRLKDQVDHAALASSLAGAARRARLGLVIRSLREKAQSSQANLKRLLAEKEQGGQVRGTRAFWIFNGFSLEGATAATLREIAGRDDVEVVALDRVVTLKSQARSAAAAFSPTWNLALIGAPTLWSRGFRGQGVVVASLDSGVDLSHPALKLKWRGGANSWFDPYRGSNVPYDQAGQDSGHGTQVMGIMVGGNTSDNQVGVAPGATWIAAKVFDDNGNATLSAIHAAFQWVVNPDGDPASHDAPDVVNNSWDLANPGQYDAEFAQDIQTLKSAGIAVVCSAGNYGVPIGLQANTSVSPANNPGAFAVGASDSNDLAAYFSGRGPSAFDGSGLYPALVAPGVNVRTTDLNGTYSVFTNLGTSFSAPHAAGAMALLLSGRPQALAGNPDALENALKASASDLGSFGPDNSYGYGRLQVATAASQLALLPPAGPTGDVNGDGVVDIADALLVLKAAVGMIPVTPFIMQQGDVAPLYNGAADPDGAINVLDALAILQKAVNLITF
jgi:serine protease AprX